MMVQKQRISLLSSFSIWIILSSSILVEKNLNKTLLITINHFFFNKFIKVSINKAHVLGHFHALYIILFL